MQSDLKGSTQEMQEVDGSIAELQKLQPVSFLIFISDSRREVINYALL